MDSSSLQKFLQDHSSVSSDNEHAVRLQPLNLADYTHEEIYARVDSL